MSIAALATFSASAAPLAAQTVGLTRVGPIDPVAGFPFYYEDRTGLRLQLCQNAGLCAFVLPNPGPLSFPTNYPGEQFYYLLSGDMTGATSAARLLYISALEAGFVNGSPVAGEQMVFTRLRIRITGLVDGATYTITHPYGTKRLVAGVDGPTPGSINITDDIGLAAGAFSQALTGNVGPFVTPTAFTVRAPGVFISDNATLTPVTGSPFGTNFLRIQGPNAGLTFPANALNNNTAQVNEFVLQGQIATVTGVDILKAHVVKTPSETAVNVWANAVPGAVLQASAGGSLPVTMSESGASGVFFARVVLGPSANPPSVLVRNASDIPNTTASQGLTDLVAVQSATFRTGGDLFVSASSSDKANNPVLTVSGSGFAPSVLPSVGSGNAAGNCGLGAGVPPPHEITVTSSAGGSATVDVTVEAPAAQPLQANAGPDQAVAAGAQVSLSGLASTGPVASYDWTHNAGTAITLVGAATATPSFTAPVISVAIDITLTLTVRDAANNASSDSVIVHVTPIAPDVVVIGPARYVVSKNSWRIQGTASQHRSQRISVFLGQVGDSTRPIGTAVVGATGAWSVQTLQGSGPVPAPADTTIWASSSIGGNSPSTGFVRN